jgi:protein-tyrosine phosphatase
MAEALLRDRAHAKGLALEVRSAGVSTVDGLPMSAHAAETLHSRQIQHTSASCAVTPDIVDWASLILTMTAGHKRALIERYPAAVDKTHTLKEFVEDGESVVSDISELERLYSEWHMKQALGEKMSDEERVRMLELENSVPNFDIDDPFGGTLDRYQLVAEEITEAVDKLIIKIQNNGERDA